jgi:predicted ATPase
MLSFEDLTEARSCLQRFCLLHVPSLLALQSGLSFKLLPTEGRLGKKKVRHLTTTATCLKSLFDAPPRFRTPEFKRVEKLGPAFAHKALRRRAKEWKSEGSAGVYCRCRALPIIITWYPTLTEQIQNHIKTILDQLDKQPARFGIGEADPRISEIDWYPPNAFHTYWTLEILDLVKTRFKSDYERLAQPNVLDLDRRRQAMLLWSRQQLSHQVGLHSATPQSSALDSDQLAWSLAIYLRFDEDLTVSLGTLDFINQAFKCLFSTQIAGTWQHYKPLFHYKEAGNAYCYVFETFAVLLECALRDGAKASMVREVIKPYSNKLMDLWRYADSTKIPLPEPSKGFGWCSGHRTNVTSPESWASASVFSYAQGLRRLLGIWSREEALSSLNAPQTRLAPDKAAKEMRSRGDTWGSDKTSVSEHLQTMFINPVRRHKCEDKLEPDSQPIEEQQARSAILFGPPGTGKTTLIRLLADIISWKYIEIHASHFVAEGITQVQKTADGIFSQLSELDHAVVLFDEIDELVREREMEKDAFGRFLTTSMLPKLAELWNARKLLYFVATNHINYFDSAIIRSHRFDALILVSPPSFKAKVSRLTKLLSEAHGFSEVHFRVREKQIDKELAQAGSPVTPDMGSAPVSSQEEENRMALWREQQLDPSLALAKFALLRYDELDELAYRLASILKSQSPRPRQISRNVLKEALTQVADSEWRKNKSYADFLRDTRSERRDYQMLNVWEVTGGDETSVPGVDSVNGLRWLRKAADSPQQIEIPGFRFSFKSLGLVEIHPSDSAK